MYILQVILAGSYREYACGNLADAEALQALFERHGFTASIR